MLDESTFGSIICLWTITTMYKMRRPMANAVSPVKNTYITHGTKTAPVPKYGSKSTTPVIIAIVMAYGTRNIKSPISTMTVVIDTSVSCAFTKPNKAFLKSTKIVFHSHVHDSVAIFLLSERDGANRN